MLETVKRQLGTADAQHDTESFAQNGNSRRSAREGGLVDRRANIEAIFATIRKSSIVRYMRTIKAVDRRAKVEVERQVVYYLSAGWSSLVARRAHNPKVVSSNLTPATNCYCKYNGLGCSNPEPFFFSVQLASNFGQTTLPSCAATRFPSSLIT